MVEARTEKYRRIRGAILKLLAGEHPGSVDFMVLRTLLDRLGYPTTKEEALSHVVYLEDAALVRRETRKVGRVEIIMLIITGKGLNVIDGFIDDVGINTEFLRETF